MELKTYREMIGLSVADAARQNDVSVSCWRLWENGKRVPAPDNMVMLYEWSMARVTPNDFYKVPSSNLITGSSGGLKHQDTPCHPGQMDMFGARQETGAFA